MSAALDARFRGHDDEVGGFKCQKPTTREQISCVPHRECLPQGLSPSTRWSWTRFLPRLRTFAVEPTFSGAIVRSVADLIRYSCKTASYILT